MRAVFQKSETSPFFFALALLVTESEPGSALLQAHIRRALNLITLRLDCIDLINGMALSDGYVVVDMTQDLQERSRLMESLAG